MASQTFQPPEARCEVFTFKEGILSRVAHDLLFEVTVFTLTVDGGSIEATFDAGSLRCQQALKKGVPAPRALLAKDLRTIDATTRDEVLAASRFPEITFRGSLAPEGAEARLEGTLALHGVERRLATIARRSNETWVAEFELQQPDFGIRPYTAMMGALKIKPGVRIRIMLLSGS